MLALAFLMNAAALISPSRLSLVALLLNCFGGADQVVDSLASKSTLHTATLQHVVFAFVSHETGMGADKWNAMHNRRMKAAVLVTGYNACYCFKVRGLL